MATAVSATSSSPTKVPTRGKGYFISTYQGDGNPLPTFAGEPHPGDAADSR